MQNKLANVVISQEDFSQEKVNLFNITYISELLELIRYNLIK